MRVNLQINNEADIQLHGNNKAYGTNTHSKTGSGDIQSQFTYGNPY